MSLLKKLRFEITILSLGLIAIHLAFLPDAFRETQEIDQQSAGLFGDFVGGYFGTIFTLCSAVLLYATLKSQIQSAQRLSFESRFHELLRLHRENVAEIKVGDTSGRSFFDWVWKEYRLIYSNRHGDFPPDQHSELQRITIAYYCVFFGTDGNDEDSLHSYVEEESRHTDWAVIPYIISRSKQHTSNFPYQPFNGHQSVLGHYYRHLYQTIKYIDTREFLTETEKYEFAKTLRAQLSNHEQALLLINSLTPIGRNWLRKGYLKKYKLAKNIPRDFFKPLNEHNLAKLGDGYFEWEEIWTA